MYPSDQQWALFQRYQNCPPPMHPRTFLQRWDVSYPDIARLVVSQKLISGKVGHPKPDCSPCDAYCFSL